MRNVEFKHLGLTWVENGKKDSASEEYLLVKGYCKMSPAVLYGWF